jgi:hypothetical protein
MPNVSEAQYQEMKRACYIYDCYKCKHQKIGEKEVPCLDSDYSCETCKYDCPCKSCRKGSNWEWSGLPEV